MVFSDYLQFLSAFLEQLTASLGKTGRGNFYNLYEVVSQMYPGSDVEMLERKGVFCYDYVDSFARLDKPALPLERRSSTSSEAWSVWRLITLTPSRCSRILSERASKIICSSTS